MVLVEDVADVMVPVQVVVLVAQVVNPVVRRVVAALVLLHAQILVALHPLKI